MSAATTIDRRRLPPAVPVGIGLAWAAAGAAHAFGLAHRFHHDALIGDHGTLDIATIAGFAALWTVMVAAMMLPSAVPLLRLFAETATGQSRPERLTGSAVAGYLAVWSIFGWVALAFDGAVHHTVDALPWLAARPWLVGTTTLALAGAFQFSRLKDRCLTECRHPAAFLLRHYRRGARAAFDLGWRHGLYCLGCCWALMLVMLAAGIADLRWMAALGALMTYEKVGRHGEVVAASAGLVALALAAVTGIHRGWSPLPPGGG